MISLMPTGMSPFLFSIILLLNNKAEPSLIPRIEHAYRQSCPDSYGTGLGMMGGNMGGMGINHLPGNQMMLYGRGMYPVSRVFTRWRVGAGSVGFTDE
jgi:hypothetical protein